MDAIRNRIAAKSRQMEVLDMRIGKLMSQRVTVEEEIAALLDKLPKEGL